MGLSPRTADRSDAELVEACLAGDVVAFSELVERYQQLVCAVSYSACGDVALSEDIAQEVFVTAWSDFDKLREPAKLKSWLCSIARNLARDVRRKRRREVAQADTDLDRETDAGPTPLEAAESSQRSDVVWGALADIPESYREPLVLFYREGQSLKQVASLLGLTITTVKQRLSRGRKALRGTLAPIASALVDTAPGKAFTASVVVAALARTKIAAAAGAGAGAAMARSAPDTITAGEAVGRPASAAGAAGATKLIAGGVIAAIAVGALWFLTRPDDEPSASRAAAEPYAETAHKPLPTLYGAAVEPGDAAGDLVVEGVVVDVFDNPVAGAVVTVSGKPPKIATTGNDGRFRIGGLADRVYGVDAHTESGSAPPLAFRAGARAPVVLRIEPGSTLEITAIDAVTDDVMEGVAVELESDLRTAEARTDAAGKVVFHGVTAHETQLKLRADGYAAMSVPINLSGQPGVNRRRLVLRRGKPVTGRVVDPSGQPVADAQIGLDGGIKLMAFDTRDVRTDAEGRWRIDAVAPGHYQVHVDHDRWLPALIELEVGERPTTAPEVQLGDGKSLRGRVLGADGTPAPGAAVTAFSAEVQKRAIADAGGEFALEGLPAGPVKITAERYPNTADVIEVDLGSGEPAPVIVRLGDACIRGRVVDAGGAPVVGGRVRAHSWRVDVFDLHQSHDRTDARGRFALCRLQRGHEYGITAIADGVPLFFLYEDAPMAKAEVGGAPVTVKLGEPGVIVGELTGDVPREFGVALSRARRGSYVDVTIPFAGTDGEFALTEIPAGTYTVMVSAEGFSTAVYRAIEVRPGGVVELPPTALSRPSTLGGVVVDARGRPVAGAVVHAGRGLGGNEREMVEMPEGGDIDGDPNGPGASTFRAVTGADGRFVIEVREPPQMFVLLAAEHPRLGRSAPKTVKLETRDNRVTLAPTGSLSGRVRGGADGMVVAFALGADGRETDYVLTAEIGAGGAYRFETIGAGRWKVAASSGDGFPSASSPGVVTVEVAAGGTTRRDLSVAGKRPPWDEAGLEEVERIARSACDCEDDGCRADAENRFRSAIQSRRMPEGAQLDRTDAAIEVFEKCMGFGR